MTDCTILLPAAGASSRMRGADKLVQPVGGQPLLARQARAALATGAPVIVTLPPPDHPFSPARLAAIGGLALARLEVAGAAEGMAASIRTAVAALPAATTGLLILLPDLPELDTEDLQRLLAAHEAAPGTICRATAEDGTPGHPVLFPARLFPALAGLHGDQGARAALAGERPLPVPLPGRRATRDLDTPEDWAAWRAETGL